jgi:hypothetical protein
MAINPARNNPNRRPRVHEPFSNDAGQIRTGDRRPENSAPGKTLTLRAYNQLIQSRHQRLDADLSMFQGQN